MTCAAQDPQDQQLGDVVILLLASTLAGLRDRLHADGFHEAAELVADLVELTDDYLIHIPDRKESPTIR